MLLSSSGPDGSFVQERNATDTARAKAARCAAVKPARPEGAPRRTNSTRLPHRESLATGPHRLSLATGPQGVSLTTKPHEDDLPGDLRRKDRGGLMHADDSDVSRPTMFIGECPIGFICVYDEKMTTGAVHARTGHRTAGPLRGGTHVLTNRIECLPPRSSEVFNESQYTTSSLTRTVRGGIG